MGSLAGVEITLDYSWFILLFVVMGTLGGAVFPAHAPELSRLAHLWMGVAGTALFFASLLGHEMAHMIMARARGMEVQGITLFIFGGMARTGKEASTPGDEFVVAGVGPLASFIFAFLLYLGARLADGAGLGLPIVLVAEYLAYLNLLLATFNLLPGFPLDGGRLLRAVLWRVTGDFRRATRIATAAGSGLAWAIIGLGVWAMITVSAFVAGLWMVFIGWFLGHAARVSYRHVLLRDLLGPLTAREAMSPDPETVPPDLPLAELVHGHLLRRPYNAFPVTEDGIVVGLVTLAQVKRVPREAWEGHIVADVMSPLEAVPVVDPDLSMLSVLERMQNEDARRVLVARDGELAGIISSSDISRWLERTALAEADRKNPGGRR